MILYKKYIYLFINLLRKKYFFCVFVTEECLIMYLGIILKDIDSYLDEYGHGIE
jgi:hypothetical protein